ncbi:MULTISPECIES: hypothetical protein [Streptomyces]|uniref:hypothetical protein n=1 Tax=Streptomyces TaxID=1883 RepID=UPI001E5EFD1D|nr:MULTISPECIES: hypothetical protein [Streptomyces]UFQ19965.1 hypothetical protein J2N69_36200 [Streptomyces huasconensis]WCL89586.1 hypothetical protein PPN52_36140 [Streptomyces sp. JCM 35825]
MFKHRRVRVACVALVSWVVLAAVERWAEYATTWPGALAHGALWSCVVAGTWWFVEMTQGHSPRADTAREPGEPGHHG